MQNKQPRFFKQRVEKIVAKIPKGKVMSYGRVAYYAGVPGAARAVGTIMSHNEDTKTVPCHRVVQSNGFIGQYGFGGPTKKEALLKKEGVKIKNGKVLPESVLR